MKHRITFVPLLNIIDEPILLYFQSIIIIFQNSVP